MKLFIFLLREKTTSYFSLSANQKEQLGDLVLSILFIFTGMVLAVSVI